MTDIIENDDIDTLDVMAEVHEEAECEVCGSDKEVSRGLCKGCRFCQCCGDEFAPDDKKYYENDGPICRACKDNLDNEDAICGNCNGSGEGMWDGSTCRVCRGSGVAPRD